MTPGAYIALARDLFIVLAIGFILWRVYTDGQNAVKVRDITALKTQLDDNTRKLTQWAQEASDAQAQRTRDLAQVSDAIAAQRAPVFVRSGPPSACPMSHVAAGTADRPASSGSADAGSGIDLRPQINRYELRVEALVADCRAALASWPK